MLVEQSQPFMKMNRRSHDKECRALERFSLKLPTRISVLESGNPRLELLTADISAGGAFFPTPKPLPEGLTVLVELTLRRESGEGGASRITVRGKVLRSQPDVMAVRFEKRVHFSPLH
jgi:LuxR family transcriptional regulator, positive regulator of biofilm formation